jgi:hypothetical protein
LGVAVMIKQWASWAVKIALTGGSLAFLLKKVDLGAAWEVGKAVDPWMFTASLALLVLQVGLCALRWQRVIKSLGSHLSLAQATEIFWIGNFFGLALPGAVGGDAIRMWKTHRAGMALSVAINSVMLERAATVMGLVILVTITQPLLAGRLNDVSGLWVFPALTVAGVAGLGVLCLLDRFPVSLRRWKLIRGFVQLAHDTRLVFLKPGNMLPTMAIALVGHVNLALGVWVLAVGLGAPVSIIDSLVLVPPVILITTLPISIAGLGVRELAMVKIFGFIGVAEPTAMAMSVLFFIVTVITALPGGLAWLLSKDRRAMVAKPS